MFYNIFYEENQIKFQIIETSLVNNKKIVGIYIYNI